MELEMMRRTLDESDNDEETRQCRYVGSDWLKSISSSSTLHVELVECAHLCVRLDVVFDFTAQRLNLAKSIVSARSTIVWWVWSIR